MAGDGFVELRPSIAAISSVGLRKLPCLFEKRSIVLRRVVGLCSF